MQTLKMTLGVTFCIFSLFIASSFAADVAKIGIIDLQRTLETSDAGKSAQAEITKQGNKMKEELKKLESDIIELKNRLDREALVMSGEMRDEKEREYRIKVNDFKTTQKRYLGSFKELEEKLVKRIRDDIMEIAKDMGKNEGYLMIIEKTVVLYYPNQIDVTDKLIKTYNAKYNKKTN